VKNIIRFACDIYGKSLTKHEPKHTAGYGDYEIQSHTAAVGLGIFVSGWINQANVPCFDVYLSKGKDTEMTRIGTFTKEGRDEE